MESTDSIHVQEGRPGLLTRSVCARWLAIVGIWTLLGVIYAGPVYVEVRAEGMNHSAWRIFLWDGLTWGVWALLTPAILWLGRRYSLEGPRWRRSLLVHVPGFFFLSSLHSAAATVITLSVMPFDKMGTSPTTFWPRFKLRVLGAIPSDLLVYAVVLGLVYAIDYYRKYRERQYLTAQLESQLAQAQLYSLRMQLHPHFLFNTLNGIVGLVRDNENKAAVDMLVGLSDLLRQALDHSNQQEVALRDELKFLELYLNIQQMRFADRLSIEIDVAPETLMALVPNLLLQPLAENAIRHGIGKRATSGHIGVTAQRENGALKLVIYDDGPGLPANWDRQPGHGIGLANTIARLDQLYGEAHAFAIHNRTQGGTAVELSIPWHEAGAGEAGA
jgi:two-component system, LytTR family, sensor kinase